MLKKLYIEPTTKCNLNCKMCFRHTWFDEPIRDLSLEDYRQVLATMPKSVETVFFGGKSSHSQGCRQRSSQNQTDTLPEKGFLHGVDFLLE